MKAATLKCQGTCYLAFTIYCCKYSIANIMYIKTDIKKGASLLAPLLQVLSNNYCYSQIYFNISSPINNTGYLTYNSHNRVNSSFTCCTTRSGPIIFASLPSAITHAKNCLLTATFTFTVK